MTVALIIGNFLTWKTKQISSIKEMGEGESWNGSRNEWVEFKDVE